MSEFKKYLREQITPPDGGLPHRPGKIQTQSNMGAEGIRHTDATFPTYWDVMATILGMTQAEFYNLWNRGHNNPNFDWGEYGFNFFKGPPARWQINCWSGCGGWDGAMVYLIWNGTSWNLGVAQK